MKDKLDPFKYYDHLKPSKPIDSRPTEPLEGELSPSGTRRSGNVGKASQSSQVASDEFAKMMESLK